MLNGCSGAHSARQSLRKTDAFSRACEHLGPQCVRSTDKAASAFNLRHIGYRRPHLSEGKIKASGQGLILCLAV